MKQWARGIPILASLIVLGIFVSRSGAEGPYKLKLPLGLQEQAAYIPADNPPTPAKIALGKMLYFDKRLSVDGTVACATCHAPRFGFTDGQPVSTGIKRQKGGRSAPTVINRLFSKEQFWDGRAADLEDQALGPIQNPIEMGNTLENVVATLKKTPGYVKAFEQAYGDPDISPKRIAQAIASFERTVLSGNSPFDRYEAGDKKALSASARRGMELFRGKARCQVCHAGFNFTEEGYNNIGVGMDKPKPDLGRDNVTKQEADRGAFKTPTLRHIHATAPYMHDGSLKTLMEVVEYYNKGGTPNPYLSKEIKPLNLTEQEKADLVAFLHALTGEESSTNVPLLPE